MENNALVIRPAKLTDLAQLLALYRHLHEDQTPDLSFAQPVFEQILRDEKQIILLGEVAGTLVSSCTVVIIPNLTRNLRSYCLIENVVTRKEYREEGYATALLQQAKQMAKEKNCYKMMLMTGAKEKSVHRFYERAGFNKEDKTAFVQWL